jgi:hypothetical protein
MTRNVARTTRFCVEITSAHQSEDKLRQDMQGQPWPRALVQRRGGLPIPEVLVSQKSLANAVVMREVLRTVVPTGPGALAR